MAVSNYTGVTTQDQNAAANTQAAAAANTNVMSTQQMPQMTSTAQKGILAGAMAPTGGTSTAPQSGIIASQMGAAAPATTAAATTAQKVDHTSDINGLFQSYFGRDAAPAGLAWYSRELESGRDLNQVSQELASSDERKRYLSLQNAAPRSAASYTPAMLDKPEQWSVTADQTAQGQMAKMADPNNPYYQQWAAAGAADAAARGFTGNSSLRQTGILDSVMRNATPIATNDASTYAKAAGYNTDQVNQFAVKNQDATNSAGQFNASQKNALASAGMSADTSRYNSDKAAETSKYGADTSAATQKYMSDQSAATQLAVSKLSNASQQTISQLHDANSVLLQNNQTAQAAYSAYVNAVANIDIQPSMDEKAKRTAITTQTNIFNSAIAGIKKQTEATPDIGSPLDVNSLVKAAVDQVGGVDVTQQLQNWS